MGLAVELARPYVGKTGPNPAVGTVVAKNGTAIAKGWHEGAGCPHAEKLALEEAGADADGADLYVTLEPCNFAGRTPACTEAIIAAGIKRVVCGTLDPNPKVAGGGAMELRNAGIDVTVNVLQDDCRRLVEAYAKYITTGLPWITVKYAATLDGKTATRTGDSYWITGEAARERAHEIRGEHSAVLVGAGTVRRDDPRLTVRLTGEDAATGPIRVIVTSDCNLPQDAKVFDTPPATWVVTTARVPDDKRGSLIKAGVEVITVGESDGWVDLVDMLKALGEREVASVLIEGGSEITGGLFDARAADKVIAVIAPKLYGGTEAKTPAAGLGVETAADAIEVLEVTFEQVGGDFFVTGYITDVDGLFPD
ncbi:MAG: bifunctional diaminohydroxyphosphoribosylaminopyrimidine deaminase/5-amino-6-(5-phosphoribosylamino)uracil reductase RibD [Candidatus Coatesbacteria bacterium]|nr:MAG: bifunctional diaminohydroxyphosphoribosylaminopyrimidine deaminase/5-amino-6-(5-phosphoribosylamino)uracil reductase RibD [Candidatus Coatesbacteria bacterium]